MNLDEMKQEVYDWAVSKGWEPNPDRTFADECALLHSEVSEAFEAFRTDGFRGWTEGDDNKPCGVASELADVLIRLLHDCHVRGFVLNPTTIFDCSTRPSFGEECSLMHVEIADAFRFFYDYYDPQGIVRSFSQLLALLKFSCNLHGFDLEKEYRQKMDYNYTRTYRHGGKVI